MGLSFQILHFLLPIPMYYSPQMFFFFFLHFPGASQALIKKGISPSSIFYFHFLLPLMYCSEPNYILILGNERRGDHVSHFFFIIYGAFHEHIHGRQMLLWLRTALVSVPSLGLWQRLSEPWLTFPNHVLPKPRGTSPEFADLLGSLTKMSPGSEIMI